MSEGGPGQPGLFAALRPGEAAQEGGAIQLRTLKNPQEP